MNLRQTNERKPMYMVKKPNLSVGSQKRKHGKTNKIRTHEVMKLCKQREKQLQLLNNQKLANRFKWQLRDKNFRKTKFGRKLWAAKASKKRKKKRKKRKYRF